MLIRHVLLIALDLPVRSLGVSVKGAPAVRGDGSGAERLEGGEGSDVDVGGEEWVREAG